MKIRIDPTDGRVWLLGVKGDIKSSNDGRVFTPYLGKATAIDFAVKNGIPYAISANKELMAGTGNAFVKIPSGPIKGITVASIGKMQMFYLVGDDLSVWRYNKTTKGQDNWLRIALNVDKVQQYVVGYALLQDGTIWKVSNQIQKPAQKLENKTFKALTLDLANNKLWAIGTDGQLYWIDAINNPAPKWQNFPLIKDTQCLDVAVHNDLPYILNQKKEVWRSELGKWIKMREGESDVVIIMPSSDKLKIGMGAGVAANGAKITRNESNETRDNAPNAEKEFCVTKQIELIEANFDRIVMGGITEKIYPGAMYYGRSVIQGSFEPLTFDRVPLNISIDLVSAESQQVGTRIGQVMPTLINQSTVNKGIVDLLKQNRNVVNAAKISARMQQIYSEEQLKIFVRGEYSGWGADVQATFGYSKKTKRNSFLMEVKQVYFTVAVNDGDELVALPDGIDKDTLFISSVSYGRIGYLRIDSDYSAEEVAATLRASYAGFQGVAKVAAEVDFQKISASWEVKGFVYGGEPEISGKFVANATTFAEYVEKGAKWRPEVAITPVSYKMKYLKDKKDAWVSMTTNYAERNCTKAKHIKIKIHGIGISRVNNELRTDPTWGYLEVEVREMADGTANVWERQVFPERVEPLSEAAKRIWEGLKKLNPGLGNQPDPRERIWWANKSERVFVSQYGMDNQTPPTNIGKEWVYYIDPLKDPKSVKVIFKFRFDSEHQDNILASVGYNGLGREIKQEFSLLDLLDVKNVASPRVLGPFVGNSDRPQGFNIIYSVSTVS
jgi:thiol-activated cytolysin